MNPFENDRPPSYSSNSENQFATTVIIDDTDQPENSDSDESELQKLQEQYNEEELKESQNENDDNAYIYTQTQPSKENTYQLTSKSPIPESESCDIDQYSAMSESQKPSQQSLPDTVHTFSLQVQPPMSNKSPDMIDPYEHDSKQQQPQQYEPYVASTTVTLSKPKKEPKSPYSPVSPLSPNANNNINGNNDDNKIVTYSNMSDPVKFVNFIARVKSHQTKKIWQTYNYNSKGYEINANDVFASLKLIDKNKENGSFIVDDSKVFVFVRNHSKFPYQMLLRTNNDNEHDAMKMLNEIVQKTSDSIQQLHVYDIGTFDYSSHFDNLINKLRVAPQYNPTFYSH